MNPIKHQQFVPDTSLPSLENHSSLRTCLCKKGKLGNNFYIFEPILVLTTLSCNAVCPLVKCKSFEGSNKASIICAEYNIAIFWRSYQFSEKMRLMMLGDDVGWWCWMMMLDNGVGLWCWRMMLDGDVGWWCWVMMLEDDVGWWCWMMMLGYDVG